MRSSTPELTFTTNRDVSLTNDKFGLIGLDHPVIERYPARYRELSPDEVGIRVQSIDGRSGVVTIWQVTAKGQRGETRNYVLPLAIANDGQRVPTWERSVDQLFHTTPSTSPAKFPSNLVLHASEAVLHRELGHRQMITDQQIYESKLIGWIEVVGAESHWDFEQLQKIIDRNTQIAQPKPTAITPRSNPDELGLGPEAKSMQALSIRQPFAEAIMRGIKTTEYRSSATKIRGRILIYASQTRYSEDEEANMLHELGIVGISADALPRGVILGSVELQDSNEGEWYLQDPQPAVMFVEPANHPNSVWFYPFGKRDDASH